MCEDEYDEDFVSPVMPYIVAGKIKTTVKVIPIINGRRKSGLGIEVEDIKNGEFTFNLAEFDCFPECKDYEIVIGNQKTKIKVKKNRGGEIIGSK